MHAVFHGDAGYWMLKDDSYAKITGIDKNPNKIVIDYLQKKGVSFELCASTMRNNVWLRDDILDGVLIVVGAYPRIIDLQMRGCSYIRF